MCVCIPNISKKQFSIYSLNIRGQNFFLGIMATVGITLGYIEYICVLSTVLADIFSDEGIPWCDGIRD